MFNAGSVIVKILGDSSGLQKEMNKSQKSLAGMGKSFQRIGAGMTAAVTLPIVGLGAASLKLASDAEETQSMFNQVFGKLASETNKWSESFATDVNRGKTAVKGFMASFQDTFVPLGYSREEAAGMSKELTKLTIDLASFKNMAEPEVLQRLQGALVGNHENMRKFGVIINETNLKQKAYEMGLGTLTEKEGKITGEISEREKVQARLAMIMEGTADAQGDAERTSDSFANQMRGLKADLADVGKKLGDALIPLVLDLVEVIKPAIEWFKGLSDEQKRIVVVIGLVVAAVGPLLVIIGTLLTSLATIAGAIGISVAALSVWIIVILAVVAIVGVLAYYIYKNWDKIKNTTIKVWDTIKNFLIGVWSKIGDSVKKAVMWIYNVTVDRFMKNWQIIKNIFNWIKNVISNAWNAALARTKRALNRFWNIVKGPFNKIYNFVANVFNGIKNAISNAFWGAVGFVKAPLNIIIGYINRLIKGYNKLPATPDLPTVPRLHSGGIVPRTGTYYLQEGEEVVSKSDTALNDDKTPVNINIRTNYLDSNILDKLSEDIANVIDDKMTARGADKVFNLNSL